MKRGKGKGEGEGNKKKAEAFLPLLMPCLTHGGIQEWVFLIRGGEEGMRR